MMSSVGEGEPLQMECAQNVWAQEPKSVFRVPSTISRVVVSGSGKCQVDMEFDR
jgi:hypothetical protein